MSDEITILYLGTPFENQSEEARLLLAKAAYITSKNIESLKAELAKQEEILKDILKTIIPTKPPVTLEQAKEQTKNMLEPRHKQETEESFKFYWNILAAEVHRTARAKGWWEKERNDGEILALIHSEVSEVLEAIRHGNPPDDKIPDYKGTEAELADVIIRIMDFAYARGWRVPEAVIAKMEMNKNREYKHGGKAF